MDNFIYEEVRFTDEYGAFTEFSRLLLKNGHLAKLRDRPSHRSLAIDMGSASFAQTFSHDSYKEVQLWNKH